MSFRPMGWSAAFLLLAPRGYAQPPVALSIENIQTRNRGAFEATISPDTRWVVVPAAGPEGPAIYLVPLVGTAAPKFWTRGRHRPGFPTAGGSCSAATMTSGWWPLARRSPRG